MSFAPTRPDEGAPFIKRTRERRRALGEIVSALARNLTTTSRGEPGQLRTTFEDALKRVVPVHAVILRDSTSRWPATRPDGNIDAVAFEVAGATPAQRGFLEAVFDRTGRLGDWDFQLLGQAAQLGTLVLELERTRSGGSARPALPVGRPRRDGAAPLIGSTPLMSSLRARIERVAQTDFTVLLEGETRAELANSVLLGSARECADWQMA